MSQSITRSALALVVAGVLTAQLLDAQQPAANRAVQQSIAVLPPNAHVALYLADGKTFRGRIATVGDNNVVMQPDDGGAPQTIAYTQISRVEQTKGRTHKKWIIIGAVGAVVVVAIVAGVTLSHRKVLNGPAF